MNLDAGSLDRRVCVERANWAANELNEQIATWEPIATLWCSVKHLDSSVRSVAERVSAGEWSASCMALFTVRWSTLTATISPMDRMVYEGRVYDIQSAGEAPGMRRTAILIVAKAKAD